KALSAKQRDESYSRIVAEALSVATCKAMPSRIDHRGLHKSNLVLLRQAVRRLHIEPEYVLCDGWPIRGISVPHLSIKKGDAVTASVAAASIVAKVERDRMMERY